MNNLLTIRGREIGKVGLEAYRKFAWVGCNICGKERWRGLRTGIVEYPRCGSCAAKNKATPNPSWSKHPNWHGGTTTRDGYTLIKLKPEDFFYSMAGTQGYVSEHRLVMAKHIGRWLHSWEIVHHKNHIRDDNRIGNLQLISDDRHKQITVLQETVKKLEKEKRGLLCELKRYKTF